MDWRLRDILLVIGMTETAKEFLEKQRTNGHASFVLLSDLQSWFFSRQKEIEETAERIKIEGATNKSIFRKEEITKNFQAAAWREFCEAIKETEKEEMKNEF